MKEYKTHKISVKNIKLNYAVIGTGKPILLIHGWCNNWIGQIPLSNELKKRYKIYLLDLPGFGDSGKLDKYSIEIAATYVGEFIKKLGIKFETILGHSMGSLVTAQTAKLYPKLTKSIVLVGAVFKTEKQNLGAKLLSKILKSIDGKEKTQSIIKRIIETRLYGHLLAKHVNMHEFNEEIVDMYGLIGKKKMTKEAWTQMGISLAKIRLEKLLNNLPIPVLLVYGKFDKIISLRTAKKVLKKVKGKFYFSSIFNSGHTVTIEKPKQLTKVIFRFLKKVK
jgi:pimeloyl-ACP methyl ester carboxylesterase